MKPRGQQGRLPGPDVGTRAEQSQPLHDALCHWTGNAKQAARRQRVSQLHSRGTLTIAQIALETSYTERHVYRLLKTDRDTAQLSLFDE